eukprot:scaffold2.g7219.t1
MRKQAAIKGSADAMAVLKTEISAKCLVSSAATTLAASAAAFPDVAGATWAALGARAATAAAGGGAGAGKARRLLLDAASAPALNLLDQQTVLELLSAAQQLAAATLPAGAVNASLDATVLAAVADAVAALGQALAQAGSIADAQRAAVVSSTVLAGNISGLVAGSISPQAFAAATSPASLSQAIQSAELPGASLLASPGGGRRKAVAIGAGVGAGAGAALLTAVAAWLCARRRHRGSVHVLKADGEVHHAMTEPLQQDP